MSAIKKHETVKHTDGLMEVQDYWERNNRKIIIVFSIIIVLAGSYFGYKYLYRLPEEKKAVEAIAKAQEYFASDSLQLALNGDGRNAGFLKVINKFGKTPSGNIARLYAGEIYLQMGDFNNALKYLKEFDARGSVQTRALVYGLMGDACSELKKNDEAIDNYKKAGSLFEGNQALSSEYLYRAASLYEVMGKNKEAIALFQQLKDKFPNTERGFSADKYLGKLGVAE